MNRNRQYYKTAFCGTETLNMTEEVLAQIRATIGTRRPECGGILGSSDGKTIDHFFFDAEAETTSGTYTMNVEAVNAQIRQWNDDGIDMVGVIHSHPNGVTKPSNPDLEIAEHIIDTVNVGGKLYIPIVQVSPRLDGSITIYPYVVRRSVALEEPRLNIVPSPADAKQQQELRLLDEKSKERFARIKGILPQEVMGKKKAVMIGCGTAREQALALARSGVGQFVIFEGDVVEAANIATQGAFISEIGMSKARVLERMIRDTNPLARVICIERFLTDEITDEEFAVLADIDGTDPADTIICGCTDNFYAQDRAMQLALKYGIPYIAGQVFKGATGHEVLFTYPGVTAACPRCMLDTRYKKMLSEQSPESTGRSGGAPYSLPEHMNSIKTYFSLLMLCYNERRTKYYRCLDRFADKNYIMTRCEEDELEAPAFEPLDSVTAAEPDLAFPYATVAIGQCPEPDCPVCGGSGRLELLIGSIGDTRKIR